MRELLKKMLMAGLVTVMVVAFAACGGTSNEKSTSESSAEPATEATEATTEASDDYDIMEGSEVRDGILYGNDFMLAMPDNDEWGYEQTSPTSVSIYLKDAREDGYNGNLVAIMAFDPDDTSYEQFPDYSVAGVGPNCGKTFIALFPTDVQYNLQDEDQAEDYNELFAHVEKIAQGMADSPFQTADSDPAP